MCNNNMILGAPIEKKEQGDFDIYFGYGSIRQKKWEHPVNKKWEQGDLEI